VRLLRAKTVSPPSATSNESGIALIELLLAMVVLNIGIFAMMATFQSGAMALRRAAVASNASAVADKVMETYRGLQNKAIYLNAPAGGGNDVAGMPNGIPNATSTWYTSYSANTSAYSATYYNYTTPANSPLWVTQASTGTGYTPIPPSAAANVPAGLVIDPTKAVQKVTGPDGQSYPVYTYIIMVQPSASYGYMKQVTVIVYDPLTTTKIVSRQSSLFDPYVAP
jgi:type II secretory pathway pseudopilin PulG